MRAVRTDSGRVRVFDVPEPENEGVRVRVRAAGICGSDLTMLDKGFLQPGNTIGHEFAGLLDDDTPVAVQPLEPCACELCRRGDYQLCPACLGGAFGIGRDGGMADEIRVPQTCLVPLTPSLRVADASLVEPLAVCVHGFEKVGLAGGARVAVVGAGSVGLLAAAVARHRGCEVDIVARHEAQHRAAEVLRIGREPSGEYDLVVDAAGSESAVARAIELCRPGADLLLLAWDWERIVLPGVATAAKELVIRATMTYGHTSAARDIDAAASVLTAHPEIADAVITHRFPLDEAPRAFEVARDRKAGAIKVVLEP